MSTVLRDIDDVLPERDLTSQQQTELSDIIRRCSSVLEDVDKMLDKFKELDNSVRISGKEPRRAWKRFRWDQGDIDDFRSRITSNITMLNTFLGRLGW